MRKSLIATIKEIPNTVATKNYVSLASSVRKMYLCEDAPNQARVGTYQTKHHDYSQDALGVLQRDIPRHSHQIYVEKFAQAQDQLFNLFKQIENRKSASSADAAAIETYIQNIVKLSDNIGMGRSKLHYLENLITNIKPLLQDPNDLKTLNNAEFMVKDGPEEKHEGGGEYSRRSVSGQRQLKTVDMG